MENFFLKLSIMLVPALMAITCHEVSHGFVADRLGDRTARYMGRLTLNPLKHLDLFGTLMVFIVGIGWAKPVPVNFGNLRNPKRDMVWVAGAGPITNFALAFLSAMAMRGLAAAGSMLPDSSALQMALDPIVLMLAFSVYINLLLGIFNLIPVPPLDGGRVAVGLLPHRQAELLARFEPYGMIVIIVLVFFTNIFAKVISPVVDLGISILAGPQSGLVYSVTHFLMR
ncbi:site-2 protease family protein [Geobacter anodireducens]|uniref:Site-2 protease family protein n=1 Tax=Geobacter anodireducens TaxID=1340425 RepID=A0ABR9NWQ8_9BACT|nr:site-2 protease family protein [Geobacter anodireducens]ANA40214.1 peptidase [Geobacter anodireducens]MBE2888696.1 site-2 protease family protein [Geobacter anodireducens]HMN03438.1 site-2 protease family protein [Geobacter anodireducens]